MFYDNKILFRKTSCASTHGLFLLKKSNIEVVTRSPPDAIESHPVAAAFWLTAS